MNCPSCHTPLVDTARFCPACGKQAGDGSELVGRSISGRYKIVAKLGEGGMGAVYRGEQISLKRAVAVKVLRPGLSADPMLLRRFNAEAEAVAKLGHPNTVNIYDFGQDSDGSLFIAMEFIEGRSLRNVLAQEGALAPRRALAIASQIAASLSDAHAHAIVHRDLKPDNVMLQDRGRHRDVVRVLDFGIAKLRDDSRATQQAMTQAGDVLGTPQYMAPEQIRGEPIDGRTDIYALGCIIYEMITGVMPFDAPTVMAMLSKHLLEQAVAPTVRRPDLALPPAIDQLVAAAMAKDPRARTPTMDAYAEQIAAVLDALPADPNRSGTTPVSAQQPVPYHSPPPGPPSSVPQPVSAAPSYVPMAAPAPPAPRPRKPPWLAIAILALAGGGLAVWAATRSHRPAQDPSPAKDPWEIKGSGQQRDPWSGGTLQPSLDVGEVVEVAGAQIKLPPSFTYKWRDGAIVASSPALKVSVTVGPIVDRDADPEEMARGYARDVGLHVDAVTSVEVNGTARPEARFSGALNHAEVTQRAIGFIGPSYAVMVTFTAPLDQRDNLVLESWENTFLGQRVGLP